MRPITRSLIVMVLAGFLGSQPVSKPLTFERLLSTQRGRTGSAPLPEDRFIKLIQSNRLARRLTEDEIQQLRNAGMEPSVVEALRKAAPLDPPPPPPPPPPAKPKPPKESSGSSTPPPPTTNPVKPPVAPPPAPVKPVEVAVPSASVIATQAGGIAKQAQEAADTASQAAELAASSHEKEKVVAAMLQAERAVAQAEAFARDLNNLPSGDAEVTKAKQSAKEAVARAAEDRSRARESNQEATLGFVTGEEPLTHSFLRMLIDAGFHPALVHQAILTRKARLTPEERDDLQKASGWSWISEAAARNLAPDPPVKDPVPPPPDRLTGVRIVPLFQLRISRQTAGKVPGGQFEFEVDIDRAGNAKAVREVKPDPSRPPAMSRLAELFRNELTNTAFVRQVLPGPPMRPVEASGRVICLVFPPGSGKQASLCAVTD